MPLRSRGTGRVSEGNLQGATNGVESSASDEARRGFESSGDGAGRPKGKVVPWRELKPVGTGFRLDRPALPFHRRRRSAVHAKRKSAMSKKV